MYFKVTLKNKCANYLRSLINNNFQINMVVVRYYKLSSWSMQNQLLNTYLSYII